MWCVLIQDTACSSPLWQFVIAIVCVVRAAELSPFDCLFL
jgi:hypothetical protein